MPECHRDPTWREILAKAVAEFLMSKPESAAEAARRVAIVAVVSLLSFATFTVVRHPEWVAELGPRPRIERSIVQRMAEDPEMRTDIVQTLETWFYDHRPHGLMLVSWHDLDGLAGIWVRPRGAFPEKEGHHHLTRDMRILAGPFVFGECAHTESVAMPGKTMVACPIANEYDVWGYVATVIDPAEMNLEYATRSMRSLAGRITNRIYGK